METPESIFNPIAYMNNPCGYCKSRSGSHSYYATTKGLTPKFYQALIDRGFRRSGSLLYKPDLRASCCPYYTIRLDAYAFKATKDQRQTLNRFTNYVLGEDYIRKAARYYPKTREEAHTRKQIFDIVKRVQEPELETLERTALKFENAKSKPPQPLEPAHKFTVTLEPDNYTDEKYAIFENYQRIVHKESLSKISKGGFKNFLCDSPIKRTALRTKENGDWVERKLGSYHQCYRLDGKLIAVGVLDLLPQCVSAVYFMYTEEVNQWNFGKLGALRETAMAAEFGYRYYYMGFYIHSCRKMRYKGDYHPQYILDAETYDWDLFDADLRRKMDAKKYVCLSAERQLQRPIDLKQSVSSINKDSEAVEAHMNRIEQPPGGDDVGVNEYVEEGEGYEDEGTSSSSSSSSNPDDHSIPQSMDTSQIWELHMPGVNSREYILNPPINPDTGELYCLGDIRVEVQTAYGVCQTRASGLVSWEQGDVDDIRAIKGVMAQIVAVLGWELSHQMVIASE